MMNKKGFEEEGMHFNVKMVVFLILFLVVLAVVMLLLIPKFLPQTTSETTTGFGKYIWDLLMGGK